MKNLLYILGLMLIMISCDDVLDKKPLDSISDADFWQSEDMTQAYVNAAYKSVAQHFQSSTQSVPWGHFLAEGTDEAYPHLGQGGMKLFNNGSASPSNVPASANWGEFYGFIQHINTFLVKVDEGTVTADAATVDEWEGEMLFLRAWCYEQLIKRFGGVIISDDPFEADDLFNGEVRSSYDACVDFIVDDLDKATLLLPYSRSADMATYATKGMAMALKSRVLLYAASKFHNPTVDQTKWQAASDAAKAVIDLKDESGNLVYGLYTPSTGDYKDVFFDYPSAGNTEVILARYITYSDLVFWWNFPSTMFGPVSWGGWGIGVPTQTMVDAFQMDDGTDYDPAVHGNVDPYENREPRFYANIIYDGMVFNEVAERFPDNIGDTIQTGLTITADGDSVYGVDGEGAITEISNRTRTGYYSHKYVRDDFTEKFYKSDVQSILIRLSEVYLNYAEAEMMLGNASEARNYIEPLRTRVSLPTPAIITMDDIEYERRVELAFEGHRFWDVRRWGKLEENTIDVYSCLVTRDERTVPTTVSYDYRLLESRVYDKKFYLFPIPESEIEKYPSIDQNPDY